MCFYLTTYLRSRLQSQKTSQYGSSLSMSFRNDVMNVVRSRDKWILVHADYSTFHSHCGYWRSCDSSRSPFVGTPILTSMSPTCSMVCLTAAWKRASSNVQVRDRKVAVSRWASHGMQKMLDHMHPTTTNGLCLGDCLCLSGCLGDNAPTW